MDTEKLLTEPEYRAVRSSGAGGQNVNKVSSKVVLAFTPATSQALSDDEKALIAAKLATRLNAQGQLVLQCDEDRSQLRNKTIIKRRFINLLENALTVQAERKPTKVPRGVIKKRIENKRRASEKKQSRRRPDV
ncbi:alternative ribosome rescue aminoacyl-tRNA hydrolase ArfB [Flavobacterium sp. RHBU_24]|uniref:alternative ribosome rescue aminoacyl-tRNA hydrolase ArfB n=1 Tax=Flavobacterium sp. RHBU_24 TaxID=3391185 RepID=UPI003984FBE8